MPKKYVYVGRFQPIHNGHIEAIKWIAKKGDLIIAIGSSNQPLGEHNPFTIEELVEMVQLVLQEIQISATIVKLPDFIGDDMSWIKKLLESLSLKIQDIIVYSQNSWTLSVCSKYGIATDSQPTLADGISATKVRGAILSNQSWEHYLSPPIIKYLQKELSDGLTGVQRIKKTVTP